MFGGNGPSITGKTETYDGTSYTEVNDLNTARQQLAGTGTQTSALAFGGETPAVGARLGNTEAWNGTNWAEVNDMNTARNELAGSGTDNTDSLAFGGNVPPASTVTELWNGSVWTEVNDLSMPREKEGGEGNTTAGLAFGGSNVAVAGISFTEEWNANFAYGVWATGANLNTARIHIQGAGTTTSSIAIGGETSPGSVRVGLTELYNGTAWAEVNDLNTARYGAGTSGANNTAALAFGGNVPGGNSVLTELWN